MRHAERPAISTPAGLLYRANLRTIDREVRRCIARLFHGASAFKSKSRDGCGRADLEGTTLSTTETIETTPQTEEQTREGHGHAHDHEGHQHGPTLNPELMREVEIEVPAEEVSRSFRSVVRRYQKQARIPGFRAGKVPESLIRTRFADSIRQDVVEAILPRHFRAEIDKQNLSPVSQPQVTDLNLEDGQPLKFKAVFEVLPEFSIDGYQQIRVA